MPASARSRRPSREPPLRIRSHRQGRPPTASLVSTSALLLSAQSGEAEQDAAPVRSPTVLTPLDRPVVVMPGISRSPALSLE